MDETARWLFAGLASAVIGAFGYTRLVSASLHKRVDSAFKKIGETREEYAKREEVRNDIAALTAEIKDDIRYIREKVDRIAEGGKR